MTGNALRWLWTLVRAAVYLGWAVKLQHGNPMDSFILSLIAGAALADTLTWLFRSVVLLPLFKWQDLVDIAVMVPPILMMSGQVEELSAMHGSELGGGFLGFLGVFMAKVAFYSAEVVIPAGD
ncbi:MAG: hypothetical protein AB7F75_02935 [Planctomycetota bacterium]